MSSLLYGPMLESSKRFFNITASFWFAFAVGFALHDFGEYSGRLEMSQFKEDQWSKDTREALEKAGVHHSTLQVWGWDPRYYLMTDTLPASRDAITQFAMIDGPYQYYYTNRLLGDLGESKPEFFLDAVCSYKALKRRCTLDHYPEVQKFVNENFDLLERFNDENGNPVNLWKRKNP